MRLIPITLNRPVLCELLEADHLPIPSISYLMRHTGIVV
jgi:hypothetical protein